MNDARLNRSLKVLSIIALSILLLMAICAFLKKVIAAVIVLGGAVFFSYLIYPLVLRFSRRMPRWLAIVCVYALLLVSLGIVFAFIGPQLAYEARSLAREFPMIMQQAQYWALNANTIVLAAVPLEARVTAVKILSGALSSLEKYTDVLATQAISILLSLASIITAFVIIPVLTFYILMDLERIRSGTLRLIPSASRATAVDVLQSIDGVLGGFIRGQIVVGAIVAVLITIMLLILHIKYALLIGVFAGIVDIIPYLGAIAGAVPAVIIALLTHGVGSALLVVAGFIITYQLEGHLIAPNIVGQRVGLTPLMVIVAVLAGAELGGILGMFVAVPIAGVIRVLATRFLSSD